LKDHEELKENSFCKFPSTVIQKKKQLLLPIVGTEFQLKDRIMCVIIPGKTIFEKQVPRHFWLLWYQTIRK